MIQVFYAVKGGTWGSPLPRCVHLWRVLSLVLWNVDTWAWNCRVHVKNRDFRVSRLGKFHSTWHCCIDCNLISGSLLSLGISTVKTWIWSCWDWDSRLRPCQKLRLQVSRLSGLGKFHFIWHCSIFCNIPNGRFDFEDCWLMKSSLVWNEGLSADRGKCPKKS